ncbi:DUF565 domain-containing protein [Pseudanabaena sp. FACHB-1998]|uniref:DUF565 domain-containing protein n=1 Tax=Pseudanabaena sp. FACHB-1998 TaxID=2692858 RepID=UPI0016815E4B|nr:DUF565 domain-containing protein [Pseudanabaena sp. FACHB-1998]MBD2177561.1 DUF565 domain-containing protein [Pseudanabaena sp. FACHB-1998]
MQNTRLSRLVDVNIQRLAQWSQNPWRRTSLIIISLLSGFFLASVISTSTGAKSELDILAAAVTAIVVELINRLVYRHKRKVNSEGVLEPNLLTIEMLNCLKLGVTYGLFLEAFKLGS